MNIHHNAATVILDGRLDSRSAPAVRQTLRCAVEEAVADIVLDVRDLVVGDSAGVSVLIGAVRAAERRGLRVALLHPPMRLRHALARAGLLSLFVVVDDCPQQAQTTGRHVSEVSAKLAAMEEPSPATLVPC